jgi:sugar transferase (PEP-CTERM/EpsH1 system associated)
MHVVYRLENGCGADLAGLLERMDRSLFRHMVVALAECDPALVRRFARCGVRCVALHHRPWLGCRVALDLYNLCRLFPPVIVQVRNLAAAMALVPAFIAGVPLRIHGIDDSDMPDPGNLSWKTWLRLQLCRPFVHQYIAGSRRVMAGLEQNAGIAPRRIGLLRRGVDTRRFCPAENGRELLMGSPFNASRLVVAGSVGALDQAHDPVRLIQAFSRARQMFGAYGERLRLVIAGDGPLRRQVKAAIKARGLGGDIWLAGNRFKLPELLRSFDFLTLCARDVGVGDIVLAGMASGLAVVAVRGGAQNELIKHDETGFLVSPDTREIAAAMARLAVDTRLRLRQGLAARERAETQFKLGDKVSLYTAFYRNSTKSMPDKGKKEAARGMGGLIQHESPGGHALFHAARRRRKSEAGTRGGVRA